jgi:hypothetical protein
MQSAFAELLREVRANCPVNTGLLFTHETHKG